MKPSTPPGASPPEPRLPRTGGFSLARPQGCIQSPGLREVITGPALQSHPRVPHLRWPCPFPSSVSPFGFLVTRWLTSDVKFLQPLDAIILPEGLSRYSQPLCFCGWDGVPGLQMTTLTFPLLVFACLFECSLGPHSSEERWFVGL